MRKIGFFISRKKNNPSFFLKKSFSLSKYLYWFISVDSEFLRKYWYLGRSDGKYTTLKKLLSNRGAKKITILAKINTEFTVNWPFVKYS